MAKAAQLVRTVSPAVRVGAPDNGIQQMFDSLARRAFEIFESNGRLSGRDGGDWLQAERELFHPAHLSISESPEGFTIRAEVPGFTGNEVQINIEGRRLTISGKRERREEREGEHSIYSEFCSDQLLRVVDLLADVNAEEAKASLKDGILEIQVPKAAPAQKIPITTKAN